MRGCFEAQDRFRQRDIRHQRNVRGFDAAIGEIDARRRFRGPADADQKDIGLVEILDHLSVIMHHRVVQRVDALEIIRVEDVLRAGPRDWRPRRDRIGKASRSAAAPRDKARR